MLDALQCIDIVNDQYKCMLDDHGQKWKHTPAQFEINRKFAREHNPTDDSMESALESTTTTSTRPMLMVRQVSTSATYEDLHMLKSVVRPLDFMSAWM